MPNRLAGETSPYLLQHKDNPVDWYPWGDEAFALAAELDRPVFLSIGYSSCHWCHVMEHESFEDDEVADLLNNQFVSIKVDREEHPDVDDAYMNAIQMMSSRGGWPASVFLTPNREPFYGGTYFPKEDREGHPGFMTVCRHIAGVWQTKRAEIDSAAREISDALSRTFATEAPEPTHAFGPETFERALMHLAHEFDSAHGGFGGAPKFPPHTSLEFMTTYAMSPICPEQQVELALGMALSTLVRMCMGGIRDHVGGGFHRYSTDDQWLLPHFEKMLYDNALMLASLVRGAIVAGEIDPPTAAFLQRAADEIVAWLMTEMRSPEGAFYSAIDADSEGEEGKYYVWSEGEIRDLLGVRSGDFIRAFGVHPHGNFADEASGEHTGANVLHLSAEEYGSEYQQDLTVLRQARAARTRPATDAKCLVGWNGLVIDSLAIAGHLVPASEAALAILEAETTHGRLPRHVTNGKPAGDAFLEDYAYFAAGLVKLSGLTGVLESEKISIGSIPPSTFWTEQAFRLISEMIEKFYDSAKGGFFSISNDHQMLFGATKPVFDQPAPSANAIAIRCLVEIGDDERAKQSLTAMLGWMERAPQATEALYATALAMLPAEGEEPLIEAAAPVAPQAPATPMAKVSAKLAKREIVADAAGWAGGEVLLSIPEGLHINSPEPIARWIVPTQLKIQPLASKVEYPPVVDEAYTGDISIPFQIELPKGSSGEEFEIEVSYQACTDSECQQPESVRLSGVAVRA